jgi:hypothetical protein
MKLERIAISCFVLIISFACNHSHNKEFNQPSPKRIQTPKGNIDSKCFDLQMEAWFVAFNEYQDKGYDMKSADQMALRASASQYQSCHISHSTLADRAADMHSHNQ